MTPIASTRRRLTSGAVTWSKQNALFYGVVALVVYFSFASEFFLSGANVEVILLNVAIIGLVAVPGAMLVLAGYVDLSVGSVAVLAAVVFGKLFEDGSPVGLCFVAALACGVAWGLIQGLLVTYGGLSPIVVTLGGLAGLRGLALWLSDAFVVQGFGEPMTSLGNGKLIGIPVPVVIFFVAFAVGAYLWYGTPVGRHLTAIGADDRAAHSLGIATKRLPLLIYVASGLAGALGGLILLSQLDASSLSIGDGLEISVLTAILLGGVSFVGGRGSLFGVFMGVLFIGIIQNGLLLIDVSAYLVAVVIGVALLIAAGLDVLYKRLDRFTEAEEGIGVDAQSVLTPPEVGDPLESQAAARPQPVPGVPLMEVAGLSKSFGPVRAVHDVSFTVEPGQVIGLVGDNGAGKSTLVSMLAGVVPPDAGEVRIDGRHHRLQSPADAQAAGIETVFQSLALVPTLDISENVFLNRETYHGGRAVRFLRLMDRRRMRSSVGDSLGRLNLRLPSAKTKVAGLSGGQRQAVAIARAVLWGSRVVILDEPTAALGVRQTEIVLQFIERLKQHDIAVILISHNMEHVLRVADRIVVMRLGEKAFDGPRADVDAEDLVAMLTGARTLTAEPQR